MSFKTEHKPKKFLEHFSKYNSLDSSKIEVAYGCWCEMQNLYKSAIKGRKDFREALRECRTENKSLNQELGRFLKLGECRK